MAACRVAAYADLESEQAAVTGVRELAGVRPDVPVLVYGGGVNRDRDPYSLADAVRDVLRNADLLRERIAGDPGLWSRFSWSGQAEVVRAAYDELLAGRPDAAWQERALHLSGSLDAR